MSIFSQRPRSSKTGFTLIELMVVLAIMVVITALFLVQQSRFDSSTVLRAVSYGVALSVRQAQVDSTSVIGTSTPLANCSGSYQNGDCFAQAYGIYFSTSDLEHYYLFADKNGDGCRAGTAACPSNPGSEDVQVYTIGNGTGSDYKIGTICAQSSATNCSTDGSNPLTSLTLIFRRPAPDACIETNLAPTACAGSGNSTYTSAYVQVVSAADPTNVHSIQVSATGEIAINPDNTTAPSGGATSCPNGLNIGTYPTCTCPAGWAPVGSSCVNQCGNGLLQTNYGEQCDLGAGNGACPATCSTSCTINSACVAAPTVTTQAASSITASGATLNGTVTATGGANPTDHGFLYATNSSLTGATTDSLGSFTTGAYTGTLSSLTCGTTYYYEAYAANSGGTGYGSVVSFATSACVSAPTVTTQAASSITAIGATLNGTVTATGGANPTDHGFLYATNSSLTGATTDSLGSFTTGAYTGTLSSLTSNTTYYFEAYGTNSAGTGYGSILSFTTSAPSCGTGFTMISSDVCQEVITSSGSYAIPSNWKSSNSKLGAIGSGGNGDSVSANKDGYAGGGGAYAVYNNVTSTDIQAGDTVTVVIAGAGAQSATTLHSASNRSNKVILSADYGVWGYNGSNGGKTANNIPINSGYAGGNGGNGITCQGGGGGGSAGPTGAGKAGGNAGSSSPGGGGGGSDGGSSTTGGVSSFNSGGNGTSGTGGGSAGYPGSNGGPATAGTGGGGGGGGYTTTIGNGGAGAIDTAFDSSHGAGGGGGGGGCTTSGSSTGGNGGTYGGGGGGGETTAGHGGQGIVIITYSP